MKFLQFKDNLCQELNIQGSFWLKIWLKLFYEDFRWKPENSINYQKYEWNSKKKKRPSFFGKFYYRLRMNPENGPDFQNPKFWTLLESKKFRGKKSINFFSKNILLSKIRIFKEGRDSLILMSTRAYRIFQTN